MEIKEVSLDDLDAVVSLVARVSQVDIFPHFSLQGKETFACKVLPDVEKTFDKARFQSLKVLDGDKLIGFGSIRDGEYITHLFIDKASQGAGLGKCLMDRLLALSIGTEVRLRASVNAVHFYEQQGFKATDTESEVTGIRFVSMSRVCKP